MPPLPPPEVVGHVLRCPVCSGALAVLFASLSPNQIPAAISCDACQERLPAFLDYERAHSAAAALHRDPGVWWHMWTCADCAELYHLTAALLDAEAGGALPPLEGALPARRCPPRLSIEIPVTRQFLRRVVAPHVALGRPWLGGDDTMLVAEELVQEYRIALYIHPSGGERWRLLVTIVPPLAGKVLVRLGDDHFQARFDQDGEALLDDVPVALLAAASGPDMQIAISGDDGDA